MAGWRLGFVLGNAEIVERVDLLQDHVRAGIFAAVQEAGIAALTGPRDSCKNGSLPGTRRGETAWSRRSAAPGAAARLGRSFYAWLELPDGVTVERLLAEAKVALAPGEAGAWAPAGAAVVRGDGRAARAWARAASSAFLDGYDAAADPADHGPGRGDVRSRPAAFGDPPVDRERSARRPVLAMRKTTTPFRLITTFQRPLQFWSTSNSVSTRPSSCLRLELPARSEAEQTMSVTPGCSWPGDGGKRRGDRQKRCEDCELAHFLPPWTTRRTLAPCSQSTGKGLVKRCPSLAAGVARYRYR